MWSKLNGAMNVASNVKSRATKLATNIMEAAAEEFQEVVISWCNGFGLGSTGQALLIRQARRVLCTVFLALGNESHQTAYLTHLVSQGTALYWKKRAYPMHSAAVSPCSSMLAAVLGLNLTWLLIPLGNCQPAPDNLQARGTARPLQPQRTLLIIVTRAPS